MRCLKQDLVGEGYRDEERGRSFAICLQIYGSWRVRVRQVRTMMGNFYFIPIIGYLYYLMQRVGTVVCYSLTIRLLSSITLMMLLIK
jgi:hypothetical protein